MATNTPKLSWLFFLPEAGNITNGFDAEVAQLARIAELERQLKAAKAEHKALVKSAEKRALDAWDATEVSQAKVHASYAESVIGTPAERDLPMRLREVLKRSK